MNKLRQLGGKRLLLLVLSALLLLAALACAIGLVRLGGLLESQKEAARWRGENELNFKQLSCFIPGDEKLSLDQVYAFRYAMLSKLKEAAIEADAESGHFVDAWCAEGKALVSSELGRGEAHVLAVGGAFFDFHPIRLLSGSYLAEGDLMKDRVLLDEDLAWLLFGGTELTGLELRVNNVPFLVGGVIRREQDFASKKAYTDGMGLYMSYEAWKTLDEDAGISCYELVLAEPVKNFAVGVVREKFPIGGGVILENTGRFAPGNLLKLLGQFGQRSMQSRSIRYPYWENAARAVEDWCALLLLLGLLAAICPVISLLLVLRRVLRRSGEKLSGDLLPQWREQAEEAVRVRQRRRWLKRHGQREDE